MRLNSAIKLYGYGTSEGVTKSWDTRGRGQHLLDNPPRAYNIPLGKTTEEHWKDEHGEWRKERAEWQNAFAEKFLAGKMPAVGHVPTAYVLGGGTASGKSTLSHKMVADNPNLVHIDADAIKPQIPEHEDLRKQEGQQPTKTESRNPNLASSRVHEESSYLAKLIMAKAAARHLDIVYDATSSGKGGGTLAGIVNRLSNEGYAIHGLWADVPVDIANRRAEERAADPNDPAGFGRHIPASAMESTHTGAAANFMLMKDSPMFSTMRLFDMTGKGETGTNPGERSEPRLIYSRGPGEKGTVHDGEKWEYYRRKAAAAH